MQHPARALALVALLAAAPLVVPVPAGAADKVRFQTDWLPSGEHAMYYGGWQKGIFAEEGIDVTIARELGQGVARAIAARDCDVDAVRGVAAVLAARDGQDGTHASQVAAVSTSAHRELGN